jgi:type III pantothenate kinase
MLASIDVGNSQVKIGLFKEDKLIKAENVDNTAIICHLQEHDVSNVIISTVKEDNSVIAELGKVYSNLLVFKPETPVPLNIDYETPNTLGIDRVAAAIGVNSGFNGPLVIVEAGSCITCDLINDKNVFRGGTISPGLQMRLQAMHTFTSKLPLLKLRSPNQLVGRSTNDAMLSGVVNGSQQEIADLVGRYQKKYPDLKVIICGGDAIYFDKIMEFNIFVLPNLVLEGLNAILRFNGKN